MRKMIDIDFGSTRYDELVELRYKILLEPLGLKFLDSHRVQEANYLHIGCIECLDDKLVGGLMLVPVDNDTIRMMQVAVDTKYQGEGIGCDLVRYAEKRARAAGYHKIVMHAMLTVVHFMRKTVTVRKAKFLKKKASPLPKWSRSCSRFPLFIKLPPMSGSFLNTRNGPHF